MNSHVYFSDVILNREPRKFFTFQYRRKSEYLSIPIKQHIFLSLQHVNETEKRHNKYKVKINK